MTFSSTVISESCSVYQAFKEEFLDMSKERFYVDFIEKKVEDESSGFYSSK
jgi:hypothetical protein